MQNYTRPQLLPAAGCGGAETACSLITEGQRDTRGPGTVVAGEFDVIRDDETVAIARAIPGARLIVVPGQGHSLPKHVPDLVTSLLLDTIDCAE